MYLHLLSCFRWHIPLMLVLMLLFTPCKSTYRSLYRWFVIYFPQKPMDQSKLLKSSMLLIFLLWHIKTNTAALHKTKHMNAVTLICRFVRGLPVCSADLSEELKRDLNMEPTPKGIHYIISTKVSIWKLH